MINDFKKLSSISQYRQVHRFGNTYFEIVSTEEDTSIEGRMNVYNGFLFLTNLQAFDPNITVSYHWYFHLEIVRTIQDLFCNIYDP